MQLLAPYRNVHTALLGTVFSLVVLLPEGSMPVHAAICRGIAQLVEGNSTDMHSHVPPSSISLLLDGFKPADAYRAVRILEASSLTASQPSVTLLCFQGSEATAKAETESVNAVLDLTSDPKSSQQPAAASSQQALCTIQLDTIQSSQLLCSMALELQAHCFRTTPLAMHVWTTPSTLTLVLDLILHAGFSLQASALNALAALLPELDFNLIPVHAVCTALLTALDSRMSSKAVPLDHPALDLWQLHMLSCLHLLAGMMDGSQSEAGAAESMLTVLPGVASLLGADHAHLQMQLCQVILHMVKQYPGLSHRATKLIQLLTVGGQLGSTVGLILHVVLQQLGAQHLDVVLPPPQVRYDACVSQLTGVNMIGLCKAQLRLLNYLDLNIHDLDVLFYGRAVFTLRTARPSAVTTLMQQPCTEVLHCWHPSFQRLQQTCEASEPSRLQKLQGSICSPPCKPDVSQFDCKGGVACGG